MEDWDWVGCEFLMVDPRTARETAERKIGRGAFIVG